jgi:hypothetical protein
MKKVLILVLAAVMALGIAFPVSANGSSGPWDLIADGRDTAEDVGDLTVSSDGTQLVVTYTMTGDWEMMETHLYVGTTPPSKSAPGKFPYKHEALADPTSDIYAFTYSDMGWSSGDAVYIAAQAQLRKPIGTDAYGNPIYAYETAWAQGAQPIPPGKNWATYFAEVLAAP